MYNIQFIADSLKDKNFISHIKNKYLFKQLVEKLFRKLDIYEYTTGNCILFSIRISDIMRLTNVYIFSDVCEIFRISINSGNMQLKHGHNNPLTRLRRLNDVN